MQTKVNLLFNWGIGFDGKDMWNFGNGFAKNIAIFDVDHTSSSLTYNRKNSFFVFGEWPTKDIHDTVGAAEIKIILTSVKQIQNFA